MTVSKFCRRWVWRSKNLRRKSPLWARTPGKVVALWIGPVISFLVFWFLSDLMANLWIFEYPGIRIQETIINAAPFDARSRERRKLFME